jgi:hypothetical protein
MLPNINVLVERRDLAGVMLWRKSMSRVGFSYALKAIADDYVHRTYDVVPMPSEGAV